MRRLRSTSSSWKPSVRLLGCFVLSRQIFPLRCVIWISRHRGFSVAQAAGVPWEPSHSDLRVLQPLGALNNQPRDPTPKSNATSCSCWVRSSQRFIDCQVRIQVSCSRGGPDQPPPVVPSPVLPGPCPLLLLDRPSSFITKVEAGLFQAAWWDPIRGGKFQSWRGGTRTIDPATTRKQHRACVRPATSFRRGRGAHRPPGIELTLPGIPGRGCSTRLLYLPHLSRLRACGPLHHCKNDSRYLKTGPQRTSRRRQGSSRAVRGPRRTLEVGCQDEQGQGQRPPP